MFLEQGSNARRTAEAIGKAVGNDFCKLNSFLCIESLQELYQLQDTHTHTHHSVSQTADSKKDNSLCPSNLGALGVMPRHEIFQYTVWT